MYFFVVDSIGISRKFDEALMSDLKKEFYARVAEFGLGAGLQTLLHGSIPSRAPIKVGAHWRAQRSPKPWSVVGLVSSNLTTRAKLKCNDNGEQEDGC